MFIIIILKKWIILPLIHKQKVETNLDFFS
jgi:hypothetical protein